jgi:hypothetical protein
MAIHSDRATYSSGLAYHGIIRAMAGEPRRISARTNTEVQPGEFNPWLQVLIAVVLIAAGLGGALLALQSHPYTGAPATDYTQVPLRVGASPDVGVLALFMFSLGLGTIGAAWFIARLIHWRFFAPIDSQRVWRQAVFAGVFVVSGAWLQLNRALSVPLAIVILGVLVLIEVFLNIRGA